MAAYTTIDDPTQYFNTVLRSGLYGGSDTAFTVGFQPDWIWDKRRSDTSVHALFDSVRGFGASGKVLYSNTNGAEADNGLIDSVSSTGFTIKASADNTGTLVDWCWKANGSGSSNTDGSETTSVSANTTAGFSIVSYTGTGANDTFGHGLGVKPSMIITKSRDTDGLDWRTYHASLGATKYVILNLTTAETTESNFMNNTEPTTSVFTLGTGTTPNKSGDNYIAYCFAEKQGYSKFGSYTGNGNVDGTFIYLGFKPVFCMFRNTTGDKWSIFDGVRNTFNEVDNNLRPNLNEAEVDQANKEVDFLSNGIKIRTSSGEWNGNGHNIVFMAFAESPFVTSTGVPTTAR